MFNRAVQVLVCSCLALFAAATPAQVKTLRMPVYGSPGQLWVDASGEIQGVRVKVLKELNSRLAKDKIELKYVQAPEGNISIKKAMEDILGSKYEAYFGLIYSKAREDDGFTFGKEEIYSIPTVVWMRSDAAFPYSGLGSLKGKRVGLVDGYPYLDDVKNPEFEVDHSAPNDEVNVQKLLDHKVDVVIDNLPRTGTAVLKLKATGKVTYAREPFGSSRFLIAYTKAVPPDVVQKVDGALKAMREGGVIKKILDQSVFASMKK